MKNNKLHLILICLFSGAIYSQEKTNPKSTKKDLKVDNEIDIYDYSDRRKFQTKLSSKENSKILVYYNNKFYAADTLNKIKNRQEYNLDIIKIPDSISQDIRGIIYLKKKEI